PEFLQSGNITPKSDIYSLGIVVFELLTGKTPFAGLTPTALLLKQVTDTIPSLSNYLEDVPNGLQAVLEKATAKNPDDRYESAIAFIEALSDVLGNTSSKLRKSLPELTIQDRSPAIEISPPMPQPMVVKPQSKSDNTLVVGMGIAILVLGGIILALVMVSNSTDGNSSLLVVISVTVVAVSVGFVLWQYRERTISSVAPIAPVPKPITPKTPIGESIAETTSPATKTRETISFHTMKAGIVLNERYEIKARLDEGDRSKVFHGYDTKMGRDVAIKSINAMASGNNQTARFRRESQVLSRLHHANIVPFFDYDSYGDINYIVMPFLKGGSLRRRLEDEFSLDEALLMASDIAGALDYIHKNNVVHRDLKTTNIVFGEFGKAYLVDFGLAKLLEAGIEQLTAVGQTIGTPDYMSPELINGETPLGASDQYSLAALLFEILANRKLYEGTSPFLIMQQHLQAEIPILTSFRGDLPPEVDQVFRKALAKDPMQRYPSVTEFVNTLSITCKKPLGTTGDAHVFISYSRVDGEYAFLLADFLRDAGLSVWIDERINPSDSWWHTIVEAIDTCGAFVVIMTPASEESRWVYRETLLADKKQKYAFPLLLEGEVFPLYIGTQATNVTNGQLPPTTFVEQLQKLMVSDTT
ncbi:MAG: protein kinase, partial [Chloroflexota bacterium]